MLDLITSGIRFFAYWTAPQSEIFVHGIGSVSDAEAAELVEYAGGVDYLISAGMGMIAPLYMRGKKYAANVQGSGQVGARIDINVMGYETAVEQAAVNDALAAQDASYQASDQAAQQQGEAWDNLFSGLGSMTKWIVAGIVAVIVLPKILRR